MINEQVCGIFRDSAVRRTGAAQVVGEHCIRQAKLRILRCTALAFKHEPGGLRFPFRQASKSLNFIVRLGGRDAFGRQNETAIVKVPRVLPRLIHMPQVADKKGRKSSFVSLSSITVVLELKARFDEEATARKPRSKAVEHQRGRRAGRFGPGLSFLAQQVG